MQIFNPSTRQKSPDIFFHEIVFKTALSDMRNLLKALWFAVNLTLPVLTSWFSGKECSDCRVWTFLTSTVCTYSQAAQTTVVNFHNHKIYGSDSNWRLLQIPVIVVERKRELNVNNYFVPLRVFLFCSATSPCGVTMPTQTLRISAHHVNDNPLLLYFTAVTVFRVWLFCSSAALCASMISKLPAAHFHSTDDAVD